MNGPRGRLGTAVLAALVASACASAAAAAEAGTTPTRARLSVAADLPFTAEELERAVAGRLTLPPASRAEPVAIEIGAVADGVQVTLGGRTRILPLAGRRGTEAARLVALAIDDLKLFAEPAPPAPGVAGTEIGIRALGGGGFGAHETARGAVELGLDCPLAARGHVRLALGAGYVRTPGGDVVEHGVPIRFALGYRAGVVQGEIGGLVEPSVVTGGAGDARVLVAATAALALRVPVGERLAATFGAGLDLFADRFEYRIGGDIPLATPRAAVWFAVGASYAIAGPR